MHEGGFNCIIDPTDTGVRDHMPMPWAVDAACLPGLLDAARTDPYALEAAETLARMHLRDGKPLPMPLAEFVLAWMDAPPKRKKKENPSTRARDEFAAMLVGYLKRHADITPTKGRETQHQNSGCDLVKEALSARYKGLTYNAVEEAWTRYGVTSGL